MSGSKSTSPTCPEFRLPSEKTLFTSLAGMTAAREWGISLARDLADYKAKRIKWEDVDCGCVVHGPPGTGKTTFAKALAEYCRVPFISTSYSSWQRSGDGHLGSVTAAIHADFQKAVEFAPCILFIDELDSIPSRNRASHNFEWFNTINNTLLEELDGASKRDGVVVIGACNNIEGLDPALTRPGRLDRFIEITFPTIEEIPDILRFHLKDDAQYVGDLGAIAVLCQGRSGADIAQLVRDARRRARRARRRINADDLHQTIAAAEGHWSDEEQLQIAVHEAGHAVAALKLGVGSKISVSMIVRKTGWVKDSDCRFFTAESINNLLLIMLAGRAAEEVLLGTVSSGAGGGSDSDLAQATHLALKSAAMLGLSEQTSLAWYDVTSESRKSIYLTPHDAEVAVMLRTAYDDAKRLIKAERALVNAIAQLLVSRRALSHTDLNTIANALPRLLDELSKSEELGGAGVAPWKLPRPGESNGELLGGEK